jgi:NADPH:quinone reductase-like Zn-dependent oxidoreductase
MPGLGASEVFDYYAGDWVQQVRALVPGGVDVLFDAAGGQTRDHAVGAVREGGRAIFLAGAPAQLGPGVVGESLDADVTPGCWRRSAGWPRRAGSAPRARRCCRSRRSARR